MSNRSERTLLSLGHDIKLQKAKYSVAELDRFPIRVFCFFNMIAFNWVVKPVD